MSSPEPASGDLVVPPEAILRASAAADLCARDLAASRARWAIDADAARGAAPEPTTGQLLDTAATWFGGALDRHARGMSDAAGALRGDQAQFQARDDAGAGLIGRAINPDPPPR